MKIKESGEEREIGECKINVQGEQESGKRKGKEKKKKKIVFSKKNEL